MDRQTDTQTDVLITILRHRSRGRNNNESVERTGREEASTPTADMLWVSQHFSCRMSVVWSVDRDLDRKLCNCLISTVQFFSMTGLV